MDKPRLMDLSDNSSDYEVVPLHSHRKVTHYDEVEAGLLQTKVLRDVKPEGKRTYDEIILVDSEDEIATTTHTSTHHIYRHPQQTQPQTQPQHPRPVVNYSSEQELLLKNQPERLISIFLILSSTENQIRLEYFEKLKELIFPKSQVFLRRQVLKVVEDEIFKKSETEEECCKISALQVLKGQLWVRSDVHDVCILLLKVITGEFDKSIKCEALSSLEIIMRNCFNYEIWKTKLSRVKEDFKDKNNENFGNFEILGQLLKYNFSISELIFSVLSFTGANDIYKQVRLKAIKLIGKIPGKSIRKILILQSLIKDRFKIKELEKYSVEDEEEESEEEGEVNLNTCERRKKFDNNAVPVLPLLCCGVFAHGIEDQFVQIRFNALNSLFSIMKLKQKNKSKYLFMNIFLDALLDESDLIRLTALKYLRRFPNGLPLTVDDSALGACAGLDSLLAVLDDQNKEIRREALIIIGNDLILLNRTSSISLNEILLRTLKCLEAALIKYPEMEFLLLESAYKFIDRHTEIIRKSCSDFFSYLMQCPIPKFMVPNSLLPYNMGSLSSVHYVMQIPFLPNKDSRLIRVLSRISCDEIEEKIKLIFKDNFIENPLISPGNDEIEIKLFKLMVPLGNFNNLQCRYESDLLRSKADNPIEKFYFFENNLPKAFFSIKTVKIVSSSSCDSVHIEEFKLIGSLDHVQLDLIPNDTILPIVYRFKSIHGGSCLIADCPKGTLKNSFKILNCTTRKIIYCNKL